MRVLVKLIPAAVICFMTFWFIAFQFDPYSWCKDSPTDPENKYLCDPFGFELDKGVLDRKPTEARFSGEEKNIYHKRTVPKKPEIDCSNDNVLMTKEGYDYCVNGKR